MRKNILFQISNNFFFFLFNRTATQFIKNLMVFQTNESPHFPVIINSIIKILYTNTDSSTTKYVAKCKLQLWSEFFPHIQKYLQTHANDFFREQQILNINQLLCVPLILVGHIKVDFMKPKWAKLFQKQIKNNKVNEICNSICEEMLQVFESQLGHFDKLLEFFLIIFAFLDFAQFGECFFFYFIFIFVFINRLPAYLAH